MDRQKPFFHGQPVDTFGQGAGMNPNTSTTGNMMTCSTAYQPAHTVPGNPEGTLTGEPARAWTGAPPLPYRPDEPTPAHWFWVELGPRIRRRPRCGEIGGNDGR